MKLILLLILFASAVFCIQGDLLKVESNEVRFGVLLDEVPSEIRRDFADHLISKDDNYWLALAKKHVWNFK